MDCIVALPKQLFYNTGIPACIWFISRKRTDEIDDGIPFETKMAELTTKLAEQMKQEKVLDEEINKQLKNVGFELEI